MTKAKNRKNNFITLKASEVSDIIQMALSDKVAFSDIQTQYGLKEKEVKALMKINLRTGSYKSWRKRVNRLGSQREFYKL